MATGKFVAYYRVSTKRQGMSGLGLDAQRESVRAFLNGGDWRLVAEFTETESGKDDARPQLAAALAACRLHRATLVVARLDRLTRNAGFWFQLRDAGVRITFVDLPEATDMIVGIMALVAEYEGRMISERTRVALAAAKRRGVVLGNPEHLTNAARRKGSKVAADARMTEADQRARDVATVALPLREGGASLREIARELEGAEIPTPRGGTWSADAVRRVLLRLDRNA